MLLSSHPRLGFREERELQGRPEVVARTRDPWASVDALRYQLLLIRQNDDETACECLPHPVSTVHCVLQVVFPRCPGVRARKKKEMAGGG